MSRIETALTRLLGIQHPILLAPMGSAAGGKLAEPVKSAATAASAPAASAPMAAASAKK